MTVAQLTNPPRSHRHSNFPRMLTYLLFKAHYHVCDIYIHVSLTHSLFPRRHTALQGIQDKQALPFPLTSRVRILPDFFSNSTLSALFVLRTTCRLEIGIIGSIAHWEDFWKILAICCCFCSCWQSLDWIGLDVYDMDMDMDISGFFTDFS